MTWAKERITNKIGTFMHSWGKFTAVSGDWLGCCPFVCTARGKWERNRERVVKLVNAHVEGPAPHPPPPPPTHTHTFPSTYRLPFVCLQLAKYFKPKSLPVGVKRKYDDRAVPQPEAVPQC